MRPRLRATTGWCYNEPLKLMELPDLPIEVRSFKPADLPACRKLYVEGLLGGKLAENDTGLDIDDIDAAYMRTPGNHFWAPKSFPPPTAPRRESVALIGW